MNNNIFDKFRQDDQNSNNSVSNPVVDKANQSLVQGHGQVKTNTNLMEGQNGLNSNNIMQGMQDVVNVPGVMQGAQTFNNNSVNTIPGQVNSNINAYTMQYEQPKSVESNYSVNASESRAVNNQYGANFDHFNNMNGINQAMQMSSNSIDNQFNIKNGLQSNVDVNQINQPVNDFSYPNNQFGMNNEVSNNINNMNQVNQPVNDFSYSNNQFGMNNEVSNNINNMNQVNQPVGESQVYNYSQSYNNTNGLKPTPTSNVGVSMVGQTEINHQPMSTDVMIDEPQQKKFPLSVREMILVSIALIGVIIVIIMYI